MTIYCLSATSGLLYFPISEIELQLPMQSVPIATNVVSLNLKYC